MTWHLGFLTGLAGKFDSFHLFFSFRLEEAGQLGQNPGSGKFY
jgi:hypothetical protein